VIERLRRFGIGDAYAMPDDGNKVTISLGLFSEQQRALRRMDDVKALGLEPHIVDRERRGTVYWIDVDVVPPAELPDAHAPGRGRAYTAASKSSLARRHRHRAVTRVQNRPMGRVLALAPARAVRPIHAYSHSLADPAESLGAARAA
jgi:hypothetical protein